ncbi:MAG TPA: protein kinase [Actinomycetota bacterium]
MEGIRAADAPAHDDPNLLVGGRYRLTEQIRGGGMGTVWQARDERLGRRVAVKILHGTLGGDPAVHARFRREAIAASKVSHPSIASVFDYIEDADRRAIVMELVEGETLAMRLEREPLPVSEARRIFSHVLAGLQAAHDRGVLHRDIKPSNVLLTPDGTVKVADFGVATIVGDATLTVTGTIMATPQYAAPEQLRGEDSTPATDVYQTGVALYEALTGRLPFRGDTPVTVAMARLSQDPEPIAVPDALALTSVVMRALEREPERRFASAAQMRAALLGTGETESDAALAASGPATMRIETADAAGTATVALAAPPATRRPHRLRRIAIRGVLIALILALVAAGLTAALSRPGSFAVPALTNRSIQDATAQAGALGLKVATASRARPGLDEGIVFSQDPPPGTRMEPGDTIRLIAADGCCIVPALATYAGAESLLADASLTAGRVTFVATVDAAPGTVLEQQPAPGDAVAPGTPVDMVVANAPPQNEEEQDGRGRGKRDKNDDDD